MTPTDKALTFTQIHPFQCGHSSLFAIKKYHYYFLSYWQVEDENVVNVGINSFFKHQKIKKSFLHWGSIWWLLHRSDSNQGSDYTAIFFSLIFGLGGQNFKIWSHHSVGNSCFHLNQDMDVDTVSLVTWTFNITLWQCRKNFLLQKSTTGGNLLVIQKPLMTTLVFLC